MGYHEVEAHEIKGLKELDERLQQLPEKVAAKMLKQASVSGAEVILQEAQFLCPIGEGRKNGPYKHSPAALLHSIRIKSRTDPKLGTATAKIVAGDDTAYYAHMVEFGTVPHLIEAGTGPINHSAKRHGLEIGPNVYVDKVHHPGAKETPFMRTAADNKQEEAAEVVGEVLGDLLMELA